MAGTNLFDLAAKISADTRQFDSSLKTTQASIQNVRDRLKELARESNTPFRTAQMDALRSRLSELNDRYKTLIASQRQATTTGSQLSGVMRGLTQATGTLSGPLNGVTGRLSALTSVSSSFNSAAGVIGVTIGALSAGFAGLATLILKAEKSFADFGSEIHDTAQKMGVAAEVASTLKFAAEQSGESFEGLSAPIAKFSVLVGQAARQVPEAVEALKRFGIDPKEAINDLDGALAKVFKRIYDAPPGIARMTLAADAFGQRAGARLIPIIETMNGNFAEFRKQAEAAGAVMSQKDANAADDLGDAFDRLSSRSRYLINVFAAELAPTLTKDLDDISAGMLRNQQAAREWGKAAADAVQGLRAIFDSEVGAMIFKLAEFTTSWLSGVGLIAQGLAALGRAFPSSRQPVLTDEDIVTRGGHVSIIGGSPLPSKPLPQDKPFDPDSIFEPLRKTDTSRGGGGSKAISSGQQLLNQLTDEYNRLQAKSLELTKFDIVQKELLKEKYKHLSAALRQQIEDIATWITIDEQDKERYAKWQARIVETMKQSERAAEGQVNMENMAADAVQNLRDQLSELQFGQETNVTAASKFIIKLQAMAENTGGMTEETKRLIAELIKLSAQMDQVLIDQAALKKGEIEIGGGGKGSIEDTEKQRREERLRQIEDLSRGLTFAIDQAIYEGFHSGVKRGMISLLESLLDMLRNVFMKQLEAQLTEIFSKIQIGQGGGSWLSKLFGIVLGGLGGGLGGVFGGGGHGGGTIGAAGKGGPLASGIDYVPYDNYFARLHKGERVLTAEENRRGTGHVFNVSFNIQDGRSQMSKDTQQQVSRALTNTMRKVALAG